MTPDECPGHAWVWDLNSLTMVGFRFRAEYVCQRCGAVAYSSPGDDPDTLAWD